MWGERNILMLILYIQWCWNYSPNFWELFLANSSNPPVDMKKSSDKYHVAYSTFLRYDQNGHLHGLAGAWNFSSVLIHVKPKQMESTTQIAKIDAIWLRNLDKRKIFIKNFEYFMKKSPKIGIYYFFSEYLLSNLCSLSSSWQKSSTENLTPTVRKPSTYFTKYSDFFYTCNYSYKTMSEFSVNDCSLSTGQIYYFYII